MYDGTVVPAGRTLKEMVDDYERRLIIEALQASVGNQRRAAITLGVLPTTLNEKIKRLGLRVQQPFAPREYDRF